MFHFVRMIVTFQNRLTYQVSYTLGYGIGRLFGRTATATRKK